MCVYPVSVSSYVLRGTYVVVWENHLCASLNYDVVWHWLISDWWVWRRWVFIFPSMRERGWENVEGNKGILDPANLLNATCAGLKRWWVEWVLKMVRVRNLREKVGGWEVINQRICLHICITHGLRRYGGEGLGCGGGVQGGTGSLEEINEGRNSTYIILSITKI